MRKYLFFVDRYGKVSYLLSNDPNDGQDNGLDDFRIDLETGELFPVEEDGELKLNWTRMSSYRILVRAVDNYRPGIECKRKRIHASIHLLCMHYFFLFVDGSLSAIKEINVVILDVNDHAPGTEFFKNIPDSVYKYVSQFIFHCK